MKMVTDNHQQSKPLFKESIVGPFPHLNRTQTGPPRLGRLLVGAFLCAVSTVGGQPKKPSLDRNQTEVTAPASNNAGAQQDVTKEAAFKMPKDRDIFFRNYCYTGSYYIQFRTSGTYRRIAREHTSVEEIDRGTWTQGNTGEITLVSERHKYPTDPEANPFHITPFVYKGVIVLLWRDSETPVNRDLAEIKKAIDDRTRSQGVAYIYAVIDRKTFEDESARTREFIFYPELNKRDRQK